MHKKTGFSERLRALMRRDEYTIKKLAEAVGVSMPAVQNWRNGTVPTAVHLFKLKEIFHCSVEDLIEDKPVDKGELEKWKNVPVGQVPADVLKQMGLLSHSQKVIAFSQRPNWKEEVQGFVEALMHQKLGSKKFKMGVDNVRTPEYSPDVIGDIKTLMEWVKRLTAERGARAALAKELGVSPSSLSEWLSGVSAPDGDNTLRLHNWVAKRMS